MCSDEDELEGEGEEEEESGEEVEMVEGEGMITGGIRERLVLLGMVLGI